MTEKYNNATINRPEGDRVLDAAIVTIDVAAYTQQIKEENAWQKNDRNAITVFKTDNMTITLVALHKGAIMQPPVPEGTLSVQVVEGQIQIKAGDKAAELNKGTIAALHHDENYHIYATEECTFLLTMTK